jgi:predicted transcriptional regulator
MSETKYIKIPPKETLLKLLRDGLYDANISQRELENFLEDDQSNISKKLRGKRPISIEEISLLTSLILERVASLPQKSVSEIYVKSEDVATVDSHDPVSVAIIKMKEGSFSQIPVFERETGKWGIVTEFTIMKRMLSPLQSNKVEENRSECVITKSNWLKEFKAMPIKEAKITDEAPTYPLNTPIAEIAQALLFHYAILILEAREKIGLVTRADFFEKVE